MPSLTLPFEKISAEDIAIVGGKGANLGELTKAGFNTPSGFCVSTQAFYQFIAEAENDIYGQLDKLSAENLDELRETGQTVRSTLDKLPLPKDVEDAVIAAWNSSGDAYAYAVRSSATAEDLPHASFAGQQDTYLNIRGQEALLSSVKACFISLFTDRAILYREQNSFDHRKVGLSVVVQRMVQPDVAGILFTADPIGGNRHITSIDASFGLGEALVAGLVSADLYQVNTQSKQIINRQIAEKEIAIRSLDDGGTEQIELDQDQRSQPALTDVQVLELAMLGERIEEHYGIPQDIEWALNSDGFYITQSRPITSLYPLPEPKPDDDALHIYFSMSHFQVMTDPMPTLSLSFLKVLLPFGRPNGELENQFMVTAAGRFYADLSAPLRHPIGRRMLLRGLGNADELAVKSIQGLLQRPNFQSKGPRFNPLSLAGVIRPHALQMLKVIRKGEPEGVADKVLGIIDEHVEKTKAKLATTNSMKEELALSVVEIRATFPVIIAWVSDVIAGFVANGLFSLIMGKRGDPDDRIAIGRGLQGNVVTDMNLAVGDLADAARQSDEVAAYLSQNAIDAKERLKDVSKISGGDAFLDTWNKFIETYGARGPAEIDMRRNRWAEDPSSLLQMVVSTMNQSEPGAHRKHYQQLIEEGNQAANSLVETASKGLLGWLRGPIVRRLLRVSRALMPLREHHKFFAIRMFLVFKDVFIRAGQELEKNGQVESAGDIWFLTIPEILEVFEPVGADIKAKIAERKSEFEHFHKLTAPRVITSDGEIPVAKLEGVDAPEGALIGSPVSAGVIEGVAKVVLDPGTEALEPGEILVAPFTDPGWTPLFVNAAGLVTEIGGLMTHGSLVAREYGIPAVVGVVDATQRIKTGQRVRVHGEAGYIEILDENENEVETTSL